MLALCTKTSVHVFSWRSGPLPFGHMPTVAAGSLRDVNSLAGLPADGGVSACFDLRHVYALEPVTPVRSTQEHGRKRRNSAANLLLALAAAAAASAAPAVAAINHIAWMGSLLVLAVIRRKDAELGGAAEERSASVLELASEGGGAASVSGASAEVDTGYRLSYLFLHPWTAQVLHEVRAGVAPALDASGSPSVVLPAAADAVAGAPVTSAAAMEGALAVAGASVVSTPPPAIIPGSGAVGQASVSATGLLNQPWGSIVVCKESAAASHVHRAHRASAIEDNSRRLHPGDVDTAAGRSDGRTRSDSDSSFVFTGEEDGGVQSGSCILVAVGNTRSPSADDTALLTTAGPPRGLQAVGCTVEEEGGQFAPTIRQAPQLSHLRFTALPYGLYASPCFPYVISLQHGGIDIHNTSVGRVVQHLRLPHALGIAVCPVAHKARLTVVAQGSKLCAAARDSASLTSPLSPAGVKAGAGAAVTSPSTHSLQQHSLQQHPAVQACFAWAEGLVAPEAEALRNLSAAPERIFIFARTGIIMLRMVPVVMVS
jgi:hypothetical protein